MSSTTIVLLALITYKLLLLAVGFWASKRVKSEQDVFLTDHNQGVSADVIEKWGSWMIGLVILFLGRERHI